MFIKYVYKCSCMNIFSIKRRCCTGCFRRTPVIRETYFLGIRVRTVYFLSK